MLLLAEQHELIMDDVHEYVISRTRVFIDNNQDIIYIIDSGKRYDEGEFVADDESHNIKFNINADPKERKAFYEDPISFCRLLSGDYMDISD